MLILKGEQPKVNQGLDQSLINEFKWLTAEDKTQIIASINNPDLLIKQHLSSLISMTLRLAEESKRKTFENYSKKKFDKIPKIDETELLQIFTESQAEQFISRFKYSASLCFV